MPVPSNPFDRALAEIEQRTPSKPVDSFGQALEDRRREEEQRQVAAMAAAKRIADQAGANKADVYRLAAKYGIPYEMAASDYDRLKSRAEETTTAPLEKILRESPVLAQFISDPGHAAATGDDLDNLGLLEWLTKAPTRAAARKFLEADFGALRWQSVLRPLTADEEARMVALRQGMEDGGELGAGGSLPRQLILGLAGFTVNVAGAAMQGLRYALPAAATAGIGAAAYGQMGPQIATGEEVITVPVAAAGGFASGMAAGGTQYEAELEGGMAYDEALKFTDEFGRTIDPQLARAAAIATAAVNGAIGAFGLTAFVRSFPGVKEVQRKLAGTAIQAALKSPTTRAAVAQFMRNYTGTLSAETLAEMGQRLSTIMNIEAAKVASGTTAQVQSVQGLQQIASDVASEGAGALMAFGLGVLPGPLMTFAHDAARVPAAKASETFFEALSLGMAQSKTAKALPEVQQEFLARAFKDGPIETVYVAIDPWVEYWQRKHLNPKDITTALTGDTHAFDDAVLSGDLAIPTARYAAKLAGTEHHAGLWRSLRLGDPAAMSADDKAAFLARLDAMPAGTDVTAGPSAFDRLVQQLSQDGRFSSEDAKTMAALSAFFPTMATNSGEVLGDADELFARYGVTVTRPNAPGGAQQAAAPPPVESRLPGAGSALGPPVSAPPGVATIDGTTIPADAPAIPAPREPAATVVPVEPSEGTPLAAGVESATVPANGEGEGTNATTGGPVSRRDDAGPANALPGGGAIAANDSPKRLSSGARRLRVARRRRPGVDARGTDALPETYRARFARLLDGAHALGYAGTDATLADLFLEHIALAEAAVTELESDANVAGDVGLDLLRLISANGGIGLSDRGYAGELLTLMESMTKGALKDEVVIGRGKRAGQTMQMSRKFTMRSAGLPGLPNLIVRKGGISLDRMREVAEDSGRFKGVVGNLSDFFSAISDAVLVELGVMRRPGRLSFDTASLLEGPYGVRPEVAWWQAQVDIDEDAALFDAPTLEAVNLLEEIGDEEVASFDGDISFDVTEFDQDDNVVQPAAVDILTTGEAQPRLPGAEGVRDQEVALGPVAPVRDEFRLTPPSETEDTQTSLFQEDAPSGLTEALVQEWATEMRQRTGRDLMDFGVHYQPAVGLTLTSLQIARGARRAGLGSEIMQALTLFADIHGVRVLLDAAQKGDQETSSQARLFAFYRRFGFVRNRGQHRDFRVSENMYREPTLRAQQQRALTQGRDATSDDLILAHNLTADNLRHAALFGGIPVPSLAITRATDGLTSFGEITLLGSREMADPRGYASTKVFAADLYSPRYPNVQYVLSKDLLRKIAAKLAPAMDALGTKDYHLKDRLKGPRGLKDQPEVMLSFLQSLGVTPDLAYDPRTAQGRVEELTAAGYAPFFPKPGQYFDWQSIGDDPAFQALVDAENMAKDAKGRKRHYQHRARELSDIGLPPEINVIMTGHKLRYQIATENHSGQYRKYVETLFQTLRAGERIVTGRNNKGQTTYVRHSLDNVIRALKRNLRSGESENAASIYGLGAVRAKHMPEFTSVAAIREAKDLLVNDATFNQVKGEMETEFFDLIDALGGSQYHNRDSFGAGGALAEMLVDAAKMGLRRALREHGFTQADAEGIATTEAFLEKLRRMPTEYFEAKILREVDLSEFAAAVVPEHTAEDILEILTARGVTIHTYAGEGDRKAAVAKAAGIHGTTVLFQGSGISDLAAVFYSRLVRAVEQAPLTKASLKQWVATLTAKGGLSPGEIAYSGIATADRAAEVFTKDDLLAEVSSPHLVPKLVTLTEDAPDNLDELVDKLYSKYLQDARETAKERIREEHEFWEPSVEFQIRSVGMQFLIVGAGEDHLNDQFKGDTFDNEADAQQALADYFAELKAESLSNALANSDVDDENVVFDGMLTSSDAYRKAEEEAALIGGSYRVKFAKYTEPGAVPGTQQEVFLTLPAFPTAWVDPHGDYRHVDNPLVRIRFNLRQVVRVDPREPFHNQVMFLEEIQAPNFPEEVPAFVVKQHREMALKWALHYAAEHDLAGVSWTTGEQQVQRYAEIEAVLESASWENAPPGSTAPSRAYEGGPLVRLPIAKEVTLRVIHGTEIKLFIGLDGKIVHSSAQAWENEKLSAAIGKAFADKILSEPSGTMTGHDAGKLGGHGLRELYDVMIPKAFQKLRVVKAAGAQLSSAHFNFTSSQDTYAARMHWVSAPPDGANAGSRRFTFVTSVGTDWAIVDATDRITATSLAPSLVGQHVDRLVGHYSRQSQHSAEGSAPLRLPVRFFNNGLAKKSPFLAMTPALREAALKPQELFQPKGTQGEKRGSLRFGKDRQMTIRLFEAANMSTFLHETGHLYLEIFGDIADALKAIEPAALSDSQRRVLADYDTLLAWLGVTSRADIGRAQHEQLADGFVKYLGSGRAPSVALQPAFRRYRSWLLRIYKMLAHIGVTLTPEVVDVFDRLLASDRAIFEAQQEGATQPIFLTADTAGKSPDEFALYKRQIQDASARAREALDAKLLQDATRQQSAEWREARRRIRAQVTADVHQRPVYIALAAMQRGTTPDGQPIGLHGSKTAIRLDRRAIVDQWGEDRLRRLPRPFVYALQGGLHPDLMASMFGFQSGDELLTALERAPAMAAAIEQETAALMVRDYGGMLMDGSLTDAARAALASDEQAVVLKAEIRALHKLAREARPYLALGEDALAEERRERAYERRWLAAEAALTRAISEGKLKEEINRLKAEAVAWRKAVRGGPAQIRGAIADDSTFQHAAIERVRRIKIRDLHPMQFWTAGKRASARSVEAAARLDYGSAIEAKQQHLLNLAMFTAATQAKERADTQAKKAKALTTPAQQAALGLAGEGYLDQVNAVLEDYSFQPASLKAMDRQMSLKKWVEARGDTDLPTDLPEALLDSTRRIPWRELTVDELAEVSDFLDQILHLARLKNRLLRTQGQRDLNLLAGQLADGIAEHSRGARPVPIETHLAGETVRHTARALTAWHRKLGSLVRQMDGGQDNGPMWRAIMRPINASADGEVTMLSASNRVFAKALAVFSLRDRATFAVKLHVPAVNQGLTRAGRIMFALNWGNAGNRQRLLSGYEWTEEQGRAVIDTLEARDWAFVTAVWAQVGSFGPAIVAKQTRVYGVAPEMIEATPFETRFGPMPGGYFPIKADPRSDRKAYKRAVEDAAKDLMAGVHTASTTRRGFAKARAKMVKGMKIQLDFGVIWRHVSDVIHDLTHHEMLIDVTRILAHPEVETAIVEHYGLPVYQSIQTVLRDIAAGDAPVRAGEGFLEYLRQGTSVARMAWNLMTGLVQPLGIIIGVHRVGAKWVGLGAAQWLRGAVAMEGTVAAIHARSAFMADRPANMERETRELSGHLTPRGSWIYASVGRFLAGTPGAMAGQAVADVQAAIEQSYFWYLSRMQMLADVPTWLGAEAKALAAGADAVTAVALADQAVIDSQGSGHIKDLAEAQRGTPALKLFTQFYGYFSVVHNLGAEAVARAKRPLDLGRLAVDFLMLYTASMLVEGAIRDAIAGDDDDDEEALLAKLARQQLAYMTNTVVFLREISGAIEGYDYRGPAGTGVFAETAGLVEQALQGEADQALARSILHSAGIVFHFPATEVERMIRAVLEADATGEVDSMLILLGRKPKAH